MRNKRAISPLIATIILISICIAGGLLIYTIFFSTIGTMSTTLSIEVVNLDLVKTTGRVTYSVSIKNTGNKHISSISITIGPGEDGTTNLTLTLSDIVPGQVKSSSDSKTTEAAQFIAGKTYAVKISVTGSDGSSMVKSMTVTCTS